MEHLKRVISAAVIIPPFLVFVYYAPPILFLGFVLILALLSLREYFQMVALARLPLAAGAGYTVSFFLLLITYVGSVRWMSQILLVTIMALSVGVLVCSGLGSQRFPALLTSLFGVIFIGWGLSHLVLLRHHAAGVWYIFFLCAVLWVGDSIAMYTGKSLGRHKMAPLISPGKTWEGAVGGLVGGIGAAFIGAHFLLPQHTLWQVFCLGALVSLAAQCSDLSESMIKRYAGVKDSGELIPGHGGLLDRIDSALFATPMLVYALDFILQAPAP